MEKHTSYDLQIYTCINMCACARVFSYRLFFSGLFYKLNMETKNQVHKSSFNQLWRLPVAMKIHIKKELSILNQKRLIDEISCANNQKKKEKTPKCHAQQKTKSHLSRSKLHGVPCNTLQRLLTKTETMLHF